MAPGQLMSGKSLCSTDCTSQKYGTLLSHKNWKQFEIPENFCLKFYNSNRDVSYLASSGLQKNPQLLLCLLWELPQHIEVPILPMPTGRLILLNKEVQHIWLNARG